MSIYEFKRGDIITRIKPAKPIKIIGEETYEDRGFIGKPLSFLGIVNGCAYAEKYVKKKDKNNKEEELLNFNEFFNMLFPKEAISFPLDIWDEGWTYYIDPYEMFNETDQNNLEIKENRLSLENKLKLALENEDYNEAAKIRTKLEKLK